MAPRIVLGFLVLGAVPLHAAGVEAPFTIELRAPVRDVIVFERVPATVAIRNRAPRTQRIDIYTFGRLESRLPGGEWKPCFNGTYACPVVGPTDREFLPGATVKLETDLGVVCGGYSSPGAREIRYVYDSSALAERVDGPEGVWAGAISSEPVSVVYREAVGVDREALESVGRSTWPEVARCFPTSIYAGHDLFESRRLDPERVLEDRVGADRAFAKIPGAEGQRARERKEDRARAVDRVARLRRFLDARPDFCHARALRLDLATNLAEADLFADAAALCAALVREDADGPEGRSAAGLLSSMERLGFYKTR